MNPRLLFNVSAITEILIGFVLLLAPAQVIRLLLGDGLGQTGDVVARVLGVGLLSVGVAAWEAPQRDVLIAPRAGICIYNVGTAMLLFIFGTLGGLNGTLLWPAAIFHGLIGAAMLWAMLAAPRAVYKK